MLRVGVSPVLALLPLRSTGPSQKIPRKEGLVVVEGRFLSCPLGPGLVLWVSTTGTGRV